MTTKSRVVSPLVIVMALTAGFLIGGQAWAHEDELEVTGSYEAFFIRFDFLGEIGGFVIFDVGLQGPFELTIGGVSRTGLITFPHILRIPGDESSPASIHGSAAWIFDDDGTSCVGFMGGQAVQGFDGDGKFACSDGTRLIVDVKDTAVLGDSVRADVNGALLTGEDRDHDNDSDSDDDD